MTMRFWAAMVVVTVILGALAVRAQAPPQTPCEVELQIVQGGRTQHGRAAAGVSHRAQPGRVGAALGGQPIQPGAQVVVIGEHVHAAVLRRQHAVPSLGQRGGQEFQPGDIA